MRLFVACRNRPVFKSSFTERKMAIYLHISEGGKKENNLLIGPLSKGVSVHESKVTNIVSLVTMTTKLSVRQTPKRSSCLRLIVLVTSFFHEGACSQHFGYIQHMFLLLFFRYRSEYKTQLIKDLCLYYSYNEYLMEKLYALFPYEVNFCFIQNSIFWASVVKS